MDEAYLSVAYPGAHDQNLSEERVVIIGRVGPDVLPPSMKRDHWQRYCLWMIEFFH